MRNSETVQAFISRVIRVINQMRLYGDPITNQTIVAKVLRSLTARFDHVAAAIEESNDLSTLTLGKLSGSRQAHEVQLNKFVEKV